MPKIVAIGIYNSQIAAKNTIITKNRKTSMFEIELPVESSGISYINTNSCPITSQTIICAKPGQIRRTRGPFKCYYVHMILHEGLLYDMLINAPDFWEPGDIKIYERIFGELVNYYNTFTKSDEVIIHSLILELIYNINRDITKMSKKRGASNNNDTVIENVINYINSNLTEPLSLDKIAEFAHLSPIHFHNRFKSAVGKTMHNYIEEQRLKKAINLLLTTDYSLTKIAFECGFSSQSYFSYVFKRRMRKTPREYAREIYSRYEI